MDKKIIAKKQGFAFKLLKNFRKRACQRHYFEEKQQHAQTKEATEQKTECKLLSILLL